MNWQKGMAFIMLSCGLVVAACSGTAGEPFSKITEQEADSQPTNQPTPLPRPTDTAEPIQVLVREIPDQVFGDGEEVLKLELGQYLSTGEQYEGGMAWGVSPSLHMEIEIKDGLLTAKPFDITWSGSEVIQVEACATSRQCSQIEIRLIRRKQKFAPRITGFGDQVIIGGETFRSINLDARVVDVDHKAAELIWNFNAPENLEVDIDEGVLVVETAAEEWRGQATLELEVCDPDGLCDQSEVVYSTVDDAQLALTYIVNEGFILQVGGKKILVDGLLSEVGSYQLPITLQRAMIAGRPPFEDIDLVLTTHAHADHFDAHIAEEFLAANPGAYFVSTNQVGSALAGRLDDDQAIKERLVGVYPSRGACEQLVVNGIEVKVFNLPHGTFPNLGFLIDLGGVRILHTGDFVMEGAQEAIELLQGYDLPDEGIDIAFVATPFLRNERYAEVVPQGIQPKMVVPMHYIASQTVDLFDLLEEKYPGSLLFHKEMENTLITFTE